MRQTRITAIDALTADTANGKMLYTTTCTPCHGDNGKSGSENENVASDATHGKDGAIEQVIAGGGSMPAYGAQYTDQEIADLIGYLASLD